MWNCPMPDRPAGNYRGHAGVAEFFRKWLGTWSEYEFRLDEPHRAPGRPGAGAVLGARAGERRGARVELRVVGHWAIADGKAVRFDSEIEKEALA